MKKTIFFLKVLCCLIFSNYAFSFTVGQSWYRHENGYFELAMREYEHPQTKQRVTLLPLINLAEQSYFEKFNQQITNKTVIYQMMGTWEQNKEFRKNLNVLDDVHKERFFQALRKNLPTIASLYGLSFSEQALDLDLAQNHINISDDCSLVKQQLSMPWVDQEPNGWVDNFTRVQYAKLAGENMLNQEISLDVMAKEIFCASTSIPTKEELLASFMQTVINAEEKSDIKESIQEHLEKITANLSDTSYLESALIFNVLGMIPLEDAITALGFAPIEDGQQWVRVFKI